MIKNESSLNEFNSSKVLPYNLPRAELFFPNREENKATKTECVDMAVELAQTILAELRDPKKATADYLSGAKGVFSWGETTEEEHQACLGKMATNDMAESPFAGLTQQLQSFGRVLGIYTSAPGQARINGDFKRQLNGSDNNDGLYHCLPHNMKQSLLKFAISSAPTVRGQEEISLYKQREHKQNKTNKQWRL